MRPGFDPCIGKISWRRKWLPTPVFLPGKSRGQSLVGFSKYMGLQKNQTQLSEQQALSSHGIISSLQHCETVLFKVTNSHLNCYVTIFEDRAFEKVIKGKSDQEVGSIQIGLYPYRNCGKFLKRQEYQLHYLSPEKPVCIKKQRLEPDKKQWTVSKWGEEYDKAVCSHPAYLTYMQCTSCKISGWMKQKLESRLPRKYQ